MRVRSLLLTLALIALASGGGAFALAANDPYRPQQWNLRRVEAPMAWELSRGAGIRVAVVDTGVDLEHPDLVDRLARRADGSVLGRDFVDDDDDPSDEHGHGTLVAGVTAATVDNGIGVAGVAPEARLMPIRVLDAEGSGDGRDVDQAIRWAVDNGAHVVNLSLESVGPAAVQLPIEAPTSAVRYAWERGVVVVAASGNDSSQATDYPDESPVVLVGATTREDERASFSDTGRSDALMAPGVDIVSTWWCEPGSSSCGNEHTYGEAQGTSFAAPHVSAAVAMLRALGMGHEEAVQRLRETARDIGEPGPDDETGFGLIDIAAAVGARNPPSSPSPSPSPSLSPSPSPSPSQTPSPTTSPSSEPSPSPSPAATSEAPDPNPSPTSPSTAESSPTVTEPSPTGSDSASPPPSAITPAPTVSPMPTPGGLGDDHVSAAGRGDAGGGAARALATLLLTITVVMHARVRRRNS